MHRALKIRHKLYFQQMAPYGGSGSRVGGESGRIFPIETGVVGLAFRTGRPVVLTKKKQTTWKEIWRELRSGPNTNVQTPSRHVNSLLAMPILCPTATNEKGEVHDCVSLVVYADSQDPEFFRPGNGTDGESSEVLTKLFNAAIGLVQNFEDLADRDFIRLARDSFPGVQATTNTEDEALASDLKPELSFVETAIQVLHGGQTYAGTLKCNRRLHWDCIFVSNQFL